MSDKALRTVPAKLRTVFAEEHHRERAAIIAFSDAAYTGDIETFLYYFHARGARQIATAVRNVMVVVNSEKRRHRDDDRGERCSRISTIQPSMKKQIDRHGAHDNADKQEHMACVPPTAHLNNGLPAGFSLAVS